MKAAVFDEDLVGVHARDDHAGQVNSGALALQSFGIGARPLRIRLQGNPGGIQEFQVGADSRSARKRNRS